VIPGRACPAAVKNCVVILSRGPRLGAAHATMHLDDESQVNASMGVTPEGAPAYTC